jgi:GxxExxY protein
MQIVKAFSMPLVEESLSHEILKAAFEVHNHLGPGFTEVIYKKAMVLELRANAHAVEVEKRILVSYRNEVVGEYFLDLVVDGKVILELKAVSEILPIHKQQALAYVRAAGLPLAIVVNFGGESVTQARIANTRRKPINK